MESPNKFEEAVQTIEAENETPIFVYEGRISLNSFFNKKRLIILTEKNIFYYSKSECKYKFNIFKISSVCFDKNKIILTFMNNCPLKISMPKNWRDSKENLIYKLFFVIQHILTKSEIEHIRFNINNADIIAKLNFANSKPFSIPSYYGAFCHLESLLRDEFFNFDTQSNDILDQIRFRFSILFHRNLIKLSSYTNKEYSSKLILDTISLLPSARYLSINQLYNTNVYALLNHYINNITNLYNISIDGSVNYQNDTDSFTNFMKTNLNSKMVGLSFLNSSFTENHLDLISQYVSSNKIQALEFHNAFSNKAVINFFLTTFLTSLSQCSDFTSLYIDKIEKIDLDLLLQNLPQQVKSLSVINCDVSINQALKTIKTNSKFSNNLNVLNLSFNTLDAYQETVSFPNCLTVIILDYVTFPNGNLAPFLNSLFRSINNDSEISLIQMKSSDDDFNKLDRMFYKLVLDFQKNPENLRRIRSLNWNFNPISTFFIEFLKMQPNLDCISVSGCFSSTDSKGFEEFCSFVSSSKSLKKLICRRFNRNYLGSLTPRLIEAVSASKVSFLDISGSRGGEKCYRCLMSLIGSCNKKGENPSSINRNEQKEVSTSNEPTINQTLALNSEANTNEESTINQQIALNSEVSTNNESIINQTLAVNSEANTNKESTINQTLALNSEVSTSNEIENSNNNTNLSNETNNISQTLTSSIEENANNEIKNLNDDNNNSEDNNKTITKDKTANIEIDVKFDQKKEVDAQISQSSLLECLIYDGLRPTNKEHLIDFIKFINTNSLNCKCSFPIHDIEALFREQQIDLDEISKIVSLCLIKTPDDYIRPFSVFYSENSRNFPFYFRDKNEKICSQMQQTTENINDDQECDGNEFEVSQNETKPFNFFGIYHEVFNATYVTEDNPCIFSFNSDDEEDESAIDRDSKKSSFSMMKKHLNSKKFEIAYLNLTDNNESNHDKDDKVMIEEEEEVNDETTESYNSIENSSNKTSNNGKNKNNSNLIKNSPNEEETGSYSVVENSSNKTSKTGKNNSNLIKNSPNEEETGSYSVVENSSNRTTKTGKNRNNSNLIKKLPNEEETDGYSLVENSVNKTTKKSSTKAPVNESKNKKDGIHGQQNKSTNDALKDYSDDYSYYSQEDEIRIKYVNKSQNQTNKPKSITLNGNKRLPLIKPFFQGRLAFNRTQNFTNNIKKKPILQFNFDDSNDYDYYNYDDYSYDNDKK